MVERRSMGDAMTLNSDKRAVIDAEKAEAGEGRGANQIVPPAALPAKPHAAPEEITHAALPGKRRGRRPNVAPPAPLAKPPTVEREYESEFPPFLVSLTTRLSPAT